MRLCMWAPDSRVRVTIAKLYKPFDTKGKGYLRKCYWAPKYQERELATYIYLKAPKVENDVDIMSFICSK